MAEKAMSDYTWWQRGVIYQLYPRSWQDTNGDGVGDLPGILSRLDYLDWLGVDAVWISPFFPSPMKDFGYDVSDYRGVDPLFGSMRDFDRLLEEAHRRGLKVILDLVPNHSSDQHPWFLESKSSRDNPKRDWYIWKDPAPGGGPPNNWRAVFGGSAWAWDEPTGQYYLHSFLEEQSDLNWRHAGVQAAMLDVMRFWLDKGVDGFRVDVMWHIIKDDLFRDNPRNPDYQPANPEYEQLLPVYSTDQPEVHEIVARMRRLVDGYGDRLLIGEIYLPIGKLVAYYGPNDDGAHLPFNFLLAEVEWDAEELYARINEYEAALPPSGWPNWVLGNHDKPRIASRVGGAQARVAALLLLTLRGTPTMYYGDEIGMCDVAIPPERVLDPKEKGKGPGRDPARTPMQWDASASAGFSRGEPWLPLANDCSSVNVETQREDAGSMLTFHRRLLALRRDEPTLQVGRYLPVCVESGMLAYVRERDGRRFLVAVNLAHRPGLLAPERFTLRGRVVLGTHPSREGREVETRLELEADEGVIILLE